LRAAPASGERLPLVLRFPDLVVRLAAIDVSGFSVGVARRARRSTSRCMRRACGCVARPPERPERDPVHRARKLSPPRLQIQVKP
jgi:hypothetical protein